MEKPWETIQARLNMSDVVTRYHASPNRAGFVCCPFHNEKSPSMKIYKDSYHCFGCSAHGRAIDFVKQLFNLDFKLAVEKLNEDFGLGVDLGYKPSKASYERAAALERARKVKEKHKSELMRLVDGNIGPKDLPPTLRDKAYDLVEKIVWKSDGREITEEQIKEAERTGFSSVDEFSDWLGLIRTVEYHYKFKGPDIGDDVVDEVIRFTKKKQAEAESELLMLEAEAND